MGASGSGTTSLGRSLSEKLNTPFFDSDNFFWEKSKVPFTVKRPVEKRSKLLKKMICENRSWILSGSAIGWGDILLEEADLIFYICCDKDKRKSRIIERETKRFGKRILPGNDMYKIHIDFISWAMAYDSGNLMMRSSKSHKFWLESAKCEVVTIHNDNFNDSLTLMLNSISKVAENNKQ